MTDKHKKKLNQRHSKDRNRI